VPVEKTEKDIGSLVEQVSSGEIRLPEIQRAYVWKPTQVAKLGGVPVSGMRCRTTATTCNWLEPVVLGWPRGDNTHATGMPP
jgi:hypothetical protein